MSDKDDGDSSGYSFTAGKDDDFFSSGASNESEDKYSYSVREKQLWREHRMRVVIHSIIPLYGLFVMILQFA